MAICRRKDHALSGIALQAKQNHRKLIFLFNIIISQRSLRNNEPVTLKGHGKMTHGSAWLAMQFSTFTPHKCC